MRHLEMWSRRAGRAACWATACLLAWPALALAEARPTLLADHPASARGKSALELELGWYTESPGPVTVHVLAPFLGFRHAVSDSAEIELDWPFAFVSLSPDVGNGDSAFQSGNPFLAAYYVGALTDGYFRVGGGIAPPIANIDPADTDAAIEFAAYLGAMGIRGMWDLWLYAPDHFALVAPFQIEFHDDGLVLGGDFALAFLLGTDDQVSGDDDVIFQLAGMIGGRTGKVTFGTRLQLVWIASGDAGSGGGGDDAQLALVPFVQGDGSGFLYARVVLNLDEPLGILGDGGDVWGLFLGGGGRY